MRGWKSVDIFFFCIDGCCVETHVVVLSSGYCVYFIKNITIEANGTEDNGELCDYTKRYVYVWEKRESLFLEFSLLIFMF
jgi:ketosteroid isomerase-like protein